MGFLSNKNINLLNLHTGLVAFGDYVLHTFGALYFIKLGVPVHIVLLIWASVNIIRMIFRPLAVKFINHVGLKNGVMIGTLLYPVIYLILIQVNGLSWWLVVFVIFFAIVDNLYWLPYHVYFTFLGNSDDRGKELGARESFVTVLAATSPIIGGILTDHYGFWSLYTLSFVVALAAIIPILFTPQIPREKRMDFRRAYRKTDKRGFWIYVGWGSLFYAHEFLWVIVLFTLVGEYTTFGWLIGVEIMLMIFFSLLLGHLTDKGKGWINMLIAGLLLITVIVARSFFVSDILTIIIFEVLMALGLCFLNIPSETGFYNIAQKSPNRLWFQAFSETGWDVGGLVAFLPAAALIYSGVEVRHVMPIAIIGLLIMIFSLKEYFKGASLTAATAVAKQKD